MIPNNLADAFWGPQTANANFCEEDYAVTKYIAEFINTLSCLGYIFYAVYGLRKLWQKRNVDAFRALPYWGLIAVGILSAVYHASLKYHTQMLDDLSMLFTTTPVLHRVLTVNAKRRDTIGVAILLGLILSVITIYHVKTDEIIIHAVSFGISVTIIGIRTMQLTNRRTLADSIARRQVWGIMIFGALIFHIGFWFWSIDKWACGYLKGLREKAGLPWAFLLELHGWWHLFTGIGAYAFIAVIDHLVSCEDHKDLPVSFAWPIPWASRSILAGRSPIVGSSKKQE